MALTRREQRELNDALEREQERSVRRGIRAGIGRILSRLARRILRLEVSETAEAMERGEDGVAFAAAVSGPGGEWSRRWEASLSAPLEEAASEAGSPIADLIGQDSLPPQMREYLERHTSELANTLSATSYENVRRVVEEAQSEGLGYREAAQRLREREPDISKNRAELISATEIHRVSTGSAYYQALNSGRVARRQRLSARDERVRPEHRAIDGETVGISEPYSNGELWAGQLSVRCRCTDLYLPVEE